MGNSESLPSEVIFGHEYILARDRWNMFWGQFGRHVSFESYIGVNGGIRRIKNQRGWVMIRSSGARKIKQLSGPHGITLLYAMKARENDRRKIIRSHKKLHRQNDVEPC